MRSILIIICCFAVYGQVFAEKRYPILTDLYRIQDITEPDSSPDGRWIAYTVYNQNAEEDREVSNIWRVSVEGKHKQQLTFSKLANNTSPKWSPNGKWIAYLSSDDNDIIQIWLISSKGGKPVQLTRMKGSIDEFVWSPDSKNIALIAADEDKSQPSKPIVIDRYQFKNDKDGYVAHTRNHLYLFSIATKQADLLTAGEHDEWLPSWSPDGKYIAYVTKRGAEPDKHINADIYLIKPKMGSKEIQLTHYPGNEMDEDWESTLAWSPDSRKIAYLRGGLDRWIYYAPVQLAVVTIATGKEQIVAPMDRSFTKPKWSTDAKKIYALIEENRNTYLNEITISSGQIKRLTHGLRFDMDFVLAGRKIIILSSDDKHPAELYVLNSTLIPLTNQNQKLLDEVQFQGTEDIQYKSFDKVIINGLLMKPVAYQTGKKYPAILDLHGGPVDQFSHKFNFDWQWFAANGYAIIAANPRGSSGRGFIFSEVIYADWGNLDVKDVLAAVDHVVSIGVADPKRLAVGGWSYGGMLTNYVIARDTRFKAAVSGAGTSNLLSSYGVDQYTLEYELELGKPWLHPDLYIKLSYPFFQSANIKTPTLFMCAQLDFNIPCAGSEQMYSALKSQNIPTQLIIYPNQHHSLDKPSYMVDRLQRYKDWLSLYLH